MGHDARIFRRNIWVSKIVLVLVTVGSLMMRVCSQRLEGSQTSPRRLNSGRLRRGEVWLPSRAMGINAPPQRANLFEDEYD
jgi:hypothetical protein